MENMQCERLEMYQAGIFSEDIMFSDTLKKMIQAKYHWKIYQYRSKEELRLEVSFPDILVMDIQNQDSCILLAKKIQERDSHVKIIFVAGNINEVSEIFEAEPTYLLLKPLEKRMLYQALEKAVRKLCKHEEQMLKLYFRDKRICVPCHEIFYIESDRRYLMIYRKSRTDRVLMKLSDLMSELPDYFVRCHQSYAINIQKIVKFEKSGIEMENGKSIAVSRNRFEETKKAIEKYYGAYC